MAVFRQVHTTFWQDPEMIEYEPEEKYFYLYLMTNPHTTQCGIYEISLKLMSIELGYPMDTVSILLKKFIDRGKILYSKDTNEVFLLNWLKYNSIKSPKVMSCVEKELKNVKNKAFLKVFHDLCIRYGYPIDRLFIDYGEEEEQEQEEEKEQEEKEQEDTISGSSNNIQYLVDLYQQVVGQINELTSQWLDDILKEYGFEWCKAAMIESDKRGKRNKKYIEGILQNWKTSGGIRLSKDDENSRKIDYEASAKSKYGW
mgnify:CR=1 FL=1